MSNDKMRAQFEAWYEAWQMPAECSWFVLEADGDYFRPHTDTAWNAWQAALEHKPEVSQPVDQEIMFQMLEAIQNQLERHAAPVAWLAIIDVTGKHFIAKHSKDPK